MLHTARRRFCVSMLQNSFRVISSGSQQTKRHSSGSWKNSQFGNSREGIAAAVIGGSLLAGGLLLKQKLSKENPATVAAAQLPTYSLSEVAKHKTKDTGIWVTFKGKVYDITDFVDQHPGGSKIMLAAGGALEPFWSLYAVHKESGVMKMLDKYEIGVLKADEAKAHLDLNDPFSGDPTRHPALEVVSAKPFNAEAPSDLITDSFITPNDIFFVRNHLPVPKVDPKNFRLSVKGMNSSSRPISLSLADLKKLPRTSVTATIMCAGNRRSDMHRFRPVKGLDWQKTAVSNATWTGVLLLDLLKAKGIDEKHCKHVQFVGLDQDVSGAAYGASVPAEIALDPRSEVLVAFEMNGEPIPLDHGFPLRVIVPGVVGARSVKWLSEIILSTEESASHWQQNDYKTFSPSTDWSNANFKTSPAIMDPPVISAICVPKPGTVVEVGDIVTVRGYAWSGGGRGVIRVELSLDNGVTWHLAELDQSDQPLRRQWAWTLFTADLEVPAGKSPRQIELICKAVDSSQATQPETFKGTWNLRGLIANAWHRVPITVKPAE